MKIYELLELIDGNVTVEGTAGEWKAKVFLRLKNINQILLKYAKYDASEENNNAMQGNAHPPIGSDDDSELSASSLKGIKKQSSKKSKIEKV